MERSFQPRLVNAPIKEEINIPLSAKIKARILALQKGIPYRQAVQELLDGEITEASEDRRRNRAP